MTAVILLQFDRSGLNAKTHLFPVLSNPSNPTGHTRYGEELKELIEMAEQSKNGILLDEAYEMFHTSGDQSISLLLAVSFVLTLITQQQW